MKKIEKVLFPIDFAENFETLLPWVSSFVHSFDATLYILFVTQDLGDFTSFHVPHGNPELRGYEGPGEHRVGVSLYKHDRRPLSLEHRLEPLQHSAGLLAVRGRADTQVHVRCGQPELGEEHTVEARRVVLIRVDDQRGRAASLERADHRRQLDDLGRQNTVPVEFSTASQHFRKPEQVRSRPDRSSGNKLGFLRKEGIPGFEHYGFEDPLPGISNHNGDATIRKIRSHGQ